MTASHFIARWSRAGVGLLLMALATLGAPAAPPQRVLMILAQESQTPAGAMEQAVRSKLQAVGAGAVELYAEHLDGTRFPGGRQQRLFLDYLREKYRDRPPDVILTMIGLSVDGVSPRDLFPEVPVVAIRISLTALPMLGTVVGTNSTATVALIDVRGTLELIFRVQPDTRRIVVIDGAATAVPGSLLSHIEENSRFFSRQADFEYWTNRPMADLQEAVSRLPAGTVVLLGRTSRDVSGRVFASGEALELLLQKASVPIYVLFGTQVGTGAVGGSVVNFDRLGAWAGETALRILQGTPAASLPITTITNGTPCFDWRALRRWGISESRLPAGCVLQFRQPTFWELYWGKALAVVVFCAAQTAMIVGLLINRAKRRESEERFRLLIEQAPEAVAVLDLEHGRLVQVNAQAERLFGCGRQELLASSPQRFYAPDQPDGQPVAETMRAHNERALRGETVVFERTLCNAVGQRLQCEIRLVRLPAGQRRLVRGSFIDITELRRSEAALRASEARLAAGVELAGLGYYEVNYGENECYIDVRFREICGIPQGVRQGLEPVEFWLKQVHPDDRQFLLDERQKLHEGRIDRISTEYRYLHPAEGPKWIQHLARLAPPGTPGAGVRTYGVLRDITETRRLSDGLQAATKEWQITFDSISDMVMVLDPQLRIVRLNAAAREFLGPANGQSVGCACYTLMHGTTCAPDGCPCERTLHTGRSERLETFHEGSGKWLVCSTDPIQDAAGSILGVVHVVRDVTKRRETEAELLRERVELAHVLRVSTLGELAASVAHELNQPLGAILANAEAAELFLEQDPPALDDLRAILADIRKDDERAGEVIRRMRTLLRKHELERQPLDINSLVQEVLHLSSGDASLRGVSLAADLGPVLPKVAGDRVHLQQVLLNLILNGLDAVAEQPRERRRVRVRTRRGTDGQVEVAVIDCGHGLEPGKQSKLFEPFYTTKPNGMGMGLPVSKTIIEAHKGRLWAEEVAGGGACFCFTLPVVGGMGEAGGRGQEPGLGGQEPGFGVQGSGGET